MNEKKLGEMKIVPLVISMALPVMLSMAFQAIYNIADSLFISRYRTTAFAGVSIIQPITLLQIALANGISTGCGSLLSRCLGAEDRKGAELTIGTALSISLISIAVLLPCTIIFSRPFVSSFTAEKEAVRAGIQYLNIFALGLPALFCSLLISFILQSHGKSKEAMLVQASGAVINILMDPLFIFTFDLGAAGASIATVIGYFSSLLLALFFYKDESIVKSRPKFERKYAKDILQVAVPALLGSGAGPIVGMIFNRIVLSSGINAMVVYGMYLKMESFMFLATGGISSALVVIIGYNYGADRKDRMRSAYKVSIALGWSFMLLSFAAFQILTPLLVKLFTDDAEITQLAIPSFRALSCCFLLTAPNIITTGLLQGIGKGGRSMLITYIRFFVFLVPAALFLSYAGGFEAFCYAFLIADIPTLAVIMVILMSIRKYLF